MLKNPAPQAVHKMSASLRNIRWRKKKEAGYYWLHGRCCTLLLVYFPQTCVVAAEEKHLLVQFHTYSLCDFMKSIEMFLWSEALLTVKCQVWTRSHHTVVQYAQAR